MSNKNRGSSTPLITLEEPGVHGIMLPSGEMASSMKKLVGIRPVGSQILVELLTYSEQHPTNGILHANGKFAKDEARHGWVRKIGPTVKESDWSFREGDRVLISGSGTPVPKFEGCNDREWVLLEPYTLKAVLEESY